jgi:pyruvate/oxaloacetate carboxyltransferase
MGFKDYFIQNDNPDAKKVEEVKTPEPYVNKFPTTTANPAFNQASPQPVASAVASPSNPSCEPHLTKIMEMYEKGFNELNQDGYDFFEYFQAIVSAGADNPAAYTMALTMATSMDNTVSKEKLLSQSEFYINEINNVYNHYVTQGQAKKNNTVQEKDNEKQQLSVDLESLRTQMANIDAVIKEKERSLLAVESKYQPTLTDIDCKLMANDMAKNNILTGINKVKNGILTHIK